MTRVFCLISVLFILCDPVLAQVQTRWFKGNTHTHTLNSDGDSAPDDVVRWYREHGYNFLFITDHEYVTSSAPLNAIFAKENAFLVIQGQEITDSFDRKPYHVNALGISKVIQPNRLPGVAQTLQKNIDDVVEAGGVAQVNHPNFGWALTASDLTKLRNYSLIEIHNGHPLVNNLGGGGSPGAEELWDVVLSAGIRIFGVADDDVHHLKRIGDSNAAAPGRGWIYVRASELSQNAITEALRKGEFYASTGVELIEISEKGRQLSVSIKAQGSSRYRVLFIGKNGKVLAETTTNPATYTLTGSEGYVRAKVIESNGKMAWTQPMFP